MCKTLKKQHYELIGTAIWRSGYMKDRNSVRQFARENMLRLIVANLSSDLAENNPNFDPEKFRKSCGL